MTNTIYSLSNHISSSIKEFVSDEVSNNPSTIGIAHSNSINDTSYFTWYMKWISYIYENNLPIWKKINMYKNNLSFINFVLTQFEKELHNSKQIREPNVNMIPLENYYQYANELYLEAYGKELPPKNFIKSELMTIIKECELSIRSNLLNKKKPNHNIIVIQ